MVIASVSKKSSRLDVNFRRIRHNYIPTSSIPRKSRSLPSVVEDEHADNRVGLFFPHAKALLGGLLGNVGFEGSCILCLVHLETGGKNNCLGRCSTSLSETETCYEFSSMSCMQ
ncbi:hypothetical protein V6N11_042466 [Hibiscus sabdariffa]|uniref:Uncharacterized protein n=1 Tax=Hibiscus sabdariffa TaxID=183260 RepID=A0ABR2QWN4_9ROSI